jgi:hypothetical protein
MMAQPIEGKRVQLIGVRKVLWICSRRRKIHITRFIYSLKLSYRLRRREYIYLVRLIHYLVWQDHRQWFR